jgi:hypothetical protein
MRVAELEGEALDLWVAKAEGYAFVDTPEAIGWAAFGKTGPVIFRGHAGQLGVSGETLNGPWAPSTNWAQSGLIIEREHIEILYYGQDGTNLSGNPWEAQIGCDTHYIDQGPGDAMGGPTPLVAAMRAFVASKFGEEVPDIDDPQAAGKEVG